MLILHLCRGQAEKEFRVEVDAIGHVRHKNLVRLLGYCIEGTQRFLFILILKSSLFFLAFLIDNSHLNKDAGL